MPAKVPEQQIAKQRNEDKRNKGKNISYHSYLKLVGLARYLRNKEREVVGEGMSSFLNCLVLSESFCSKSEINWLGRVHSIGYNYLTK